MDFKAGDRIVVREWDDMEKEFGIYHGRIGCRFYFTDGMRFLCGQTGTITRVSDVDDDRIFVKFDDPYTHEESGYYKLSTDMIKLEEDFEFDIDDESFIQFIGLE